MCLRDSRSEELYSYGPWVSLSAGGSAAAAFRVICGVRQSSNIDSDEERVSGPELEQVHAAGNSANRMQLLQKARR